MESRKPALLIGVISDTHGLLRPEAVAVLAGSDMILHAGDIGSPEVLQGLRAIAPVHAVRGNVDTGPWADRLPTSDAVAAGDSLIYLLHDLSGLDLDPRAAGIACVVSGHSHRPAIREKDGVLFVNPGSAGPRRFRLPVAVARLTVPEGGQSPVRAEILRLPV